ncbi:MAG: ATP-binding cassette domain-containing protein, partial [Actinomycetes bacterium]
FLPGLSARTNLQVLADTAGVPKRRVEECLEVVGLRERARDRYKGFSLGMRQRLAIAAALLKDPPLLILDEPSNGLDPAGIREVRELVRAIGATTHCTVFVSSHLLAEVEQMCDRVAIVDSGRTLAAGTVAELLAGGGPARLRLRIDDAPRALSVLHAAGLRADGEADGTVWVDDVDQPAHVTRLLADSGLYLSELTPVGADLESAFLTLTGGVTR